MRSPKRDVEEYRSILETLEKAINTGPWDKSLFLRATGKKLRDLRDQFVAEIGMTSEDLNREAASEEVITGPEKQPNQIEVFISLYNMQGHDISQWEKLINTLGSSIVSRPILRSEQHVRELIRSRTNKKNEAYLIVYIDKSQIIKPKSGQGLQDPLGHELLNVKSGAILKENIARFVHLSGQYRYDTGHLVRFADFESSNFI